MMIIIIIITIINLYKTGNDYNELCINILLAVIKFHSHYRDENGNTTTTRSKIPTDLKSDRKIILFVILLWNYTINFLKFTIDFKRGNYFVLCDEKLYLRHTRTCEKM